MGISHRTFVDERDRERVLRFLSTTCLNEGRPHNWFIDRWINLRYSHYGDDDPTRPEDWESDIHVWETHDDRLIGLIMREGSDLYALQIHPDFRSLEPDMLDVCESNHALRMLADRVPRRMLMEIYAWDEKRSDLLIQRGFQPKRDHGRYRKRSLQDVLHPTESVPAGYWIRPMETSAEGKRMYIEALAAIFPHYKTWLINEHPSKSWDEQSEIAAKMTCGRLDSPQYRPELDLCIESTDGTIAAICTFWLDAMNHLSIIEPMGVHPDHRRKGLAQSIMLEGMSRSRALGALETVTTSYSDPAHRAYESVGLECTEEIVLWTKPA